MKEPQRRREKLISDLRKLKQPRWGKDFSAHEKRTVQLAWRYAAWVARKDLDPPAPGSPADHAWGNLAAVAQVPPRLLDPLTSYVAQRLAWLEGQPTARRFEREIKPAQWERTFTVASPAASVRYLRARLGDWEVWPIALEALLGVRAKAENDQSLECDAELTALFHDLSGRFPRDANPEYDWSEYKASKFLSRLAVAAAAGPEAHPLWRGWLRRWLSRARKALKEQPPALGDLAALVFGPAEAAPFLREASAQDLVVLGTWNSRLLRRLAELAPGEASRLIGSLWNDRSFKEAEWTWVKSGEWNRKAEIRVLLSNAPSTVLEALALHVGFTLGLLMAREGLLLAEGDQRAAHHLEELGLPALAQLGPALLFQARLWRELQTLAKYQKESYRREPELIGLRTAVMEMAAAQPEEWARALPWILECSQHLGGLAEAVTVALARESPAVVGALQSLETGSAPEEVRDRARGIRALSDGLLDPAHRLPEDLLSFAARQLDGAPVAPQMLAAPSSTWLGSHDIEVLLRTCANEAESRFREYFLAQGGIEEEAVTGRLLAELERAFGGVQTRVGRLAERASRLPTVKLVHRQVPKREEKQYGCDVAFLVSVAGYRIQGAEIAEFVQVKKPVRDRSGRAFVDRWRIDARQLADILQTSSTSVYWLLGVHGEVLVVPGKSLSALAPAPRWLGRPDPRVDFYLDYFKLRSAAIPLSQFLIDLLVGLWLGTTGSQAIQFAKGEARATTPRFIVEVKVDLSGEGKG